MRLDILWLLRVMSILWLMIYWFRLSIRLSLLILWFSIELSLGSLGLIARTVILYLMGCRPSILAGRHRLTLSILWRALYLLRSSMWRLLRRSTRLIISP